MGSCPYSAYPSMSSLTLPRLIQLSLVSLDQLVCLGEQRNWSAHSTVHSGHLEAPAGFRKGNSAKLYGLNLRFGHHPASRPEQSLATEYGRCSQPDLRRSALSCCHKGQARFLCRQPWPRKEAPLSIIDRGASLQQCCQERWIPHNPHLRVCPPPGSSLHLG